MKKYYVYLKPEKNEPYRFVTGVSRHWLFWQKVEYSWLPTVARVNDYEQLHRLQSLAAAETGREIVVTEADEMEELHRDNLFWSVTDKDGMWFTGKWYAETRRLRDNGDRAAETTDNIREAQLFVREPFAIDRLLDLQRNGYEAAVVPVYVATRNVFCDPCIVIVCVNKERDTVRYLKSYKDGDRRLRYAEILDDALMINIEDAVPVYDKLASSHKELSFTMIVRPEANIPASKLREHEKELKQAVAADFYIRKRK